MVASKSKVSLPKNAAQSKRFALVVSRYHEEIVQDLVKGATDTLLGYGAKAADIQTFWVPGSFEIPLAAHAVAQHQKVDAIVCIGVIIKGETRHDRYIAQEVARGISQVGHLSGIPVIFGVLTTETLEQAKARSGGTKGHKGVESAEAAVEMVQLLDSIKGSPKKTGGSVGFGI
jgi:6,7-dimethyl-8-ribityllumazine synthase